jgi:hypothetical protein
MMKKFQLFFAMLLASFVFSNYSVNAQQNETPKDTLVIKHPAATDLSRFFSGSTVYNLWIYSPKPAALDELIKTFKNEKVVQDCTMGAAAGEYSEIVINLKEAKNKDWFISRFKEAGILFIKVNNNGAIAIEKI